MKNLKEIRTVKCQGGSIHYTLIRKNVKNINLRVKADGSVFVSCGFLDSFVKLKSDFIIKNINKFKELEKYAATPKKYVSGEKFSILGRNVCLKVLEGETESVKTDGVYLFLTVKDKEDFKRKEQLVNRYLNKQCHEVFNEIALKIYPLFKKYGISFPLIRIREMKTRWGSCIPQKGIITLNTKLLEAPINCIEYVVLHEFCHFIHPDHSKKFYAFVAMLMPDWKERKTALEHPQRHIC